ncbi:MAG: molybdenum cofactor synthesis domain protein [Chloroflexi bacterium]|jgi:molybdopterin adenylyltransferase|nr:molybdenum cofactor synthesis domain protein [Chloroflexota bacterium]
MNEAQPQYQCAVLTISTGGAEGWREDTSGPAAQELLREAGFTIARAELVRDDVETIAEVLKRWADEDHIALIVTSGGTGLSPFDFTPEATRSVIQREVPGIAEAMRMRTLEKTPMAMISRGIAGSRGQSLIINLPGSPKGVRECLEVVMPVLKHAVALIRQDKTTH